MKRDFGSLALQTEPPGDDLRAALIAARLRNNTRNEMPTRAARIPSFAMEHAVSSDLGHLHATHDLRNMSISSRRRFVGPVAVALKRTLQRALHPLPESQSVWNGANARVVTFLLRQLTAQARAIESLEQQMAELRNELHKSRVPDA